MKMTLDDLYHAVKEAMESVDDPSKVEVYTTGIEGEAYIVTNPLYHSEASLHTIEKIKYFNKFSPVGFDEMGDEHPPESDNHKTVFLLGYVPHD